MTATPGDTTHATWCRQLAALQPPQSALFVAADGDQYIDPDWIDANPERAHLLREMIIVGYARGWNQ